MSFRAVMFGGPKDGIEIKIPHWMSVISFPVFDSPPLRWNEEPPLTLSYEVIDYKYAGHYSQIPTLLRYDYQEKSKV